MRKVLLYILLLSCLPVCLSAQVAYMEEKAKVNKIKRSSLYLYGEGIAATVEEATAMAETSLKNAILSEMGENEKLQDSDQILINSIKKHSEKIQLKRGAMERVFLYVEKKNLLSSDKVVVLDVSSSTVPSQEKPATEESKVDDSAPSGTSSSEVFTPVSEQVPPIQGEKVKVDSPLLQELLEQKTVDGLELFMRTQKENHKLMWGNVKSSLNPSWYIVVFSDTTIKAVFDKEKNGVRVNLLNGKEEQMSLYNTDNKVWFILYE